MFNVGRQGLVAEGGKAPFQTNNKDDCWQAIFKPQATDCRPLL